MQHARTELGVLLVALAGGEGSAIRAVDVGRQRDLFAVVVTECLVVRADRAFEVALRALARAECGVALLFGSSYPGGGAWAGFLPTTSRMVPSEERTLRIVVPPNWTGSENRTTSVSSVAP